MKKKGTWCENKEKEQKEVNLGGYACGKNKVFTIWHPKPCNDRRKTPYFVATVRFMEARGVVVVPGVETSGVCTGESLYRVPD